MQDLRREAARVGDLDDVGEVNSFWALSGLTAVEKAQRLGAAEGDRPGVAQARGALFGARILLLPDRDQTSVALDEAAIAGWIGGLETQRHDIRA